MIYFASDLHLGLYPLENSLKREKHFVKWLENIKADATEIYLVGDVFDFWFEYKQVVPKGYVRLLGKLAELVDSGIKIHFFSGNHDIWTFRYLADEIGLVLHHSPEIRTINNKTLYIAHGDGLGPGDVGFKFLRIIFRNPILQWFYSRIHPNIGMSIGLGWARRRRHRIGFKEEFYGESKERLIIHAKSVLKSRAIDFFIFGHRHIPISLDISNTSKCFYIGDWIHQFSYLAFDGNTVNSCVFPMPE